MGSVQDEGQNWIASEFALPADFDFGAFHLLRVDRNAGRLVVALDDVAARWEIGAPASAGPLSLVTQGASAAFAGFTLTQGWEDLFAGDGPVEALGWQGAGAWHIGGGLLRCDARGGEAVLFKGGLLPERCELVVNARREAGAGGYGIYPAANNDGPGPLLRVEQQGEAWALVWEHAGARERYVLPTGFDGAQFQQLRLREENGRLAVQWEATPLVEFALPASAGGRRVGLWAGDGAVAFDMVRATALG